MRENEQKINKREGEFVCLRNKTWGRHLKQTFTKLLPDFLNDFHSFCRVVALLPFLILLFWPFFWSQSNKQEDRGRTNQLAGGHRRPFLSILLTTTTLTLSLWDDTQADSSPINTFKTTSPWACFIVAEEENRIHTRASSTCGMLASDHSQHPLVDTFIQIMKPKV